MDPITVAVTAAVVAGVAEEEKALLVDDTKEDALDAYEALKDQIEDKYTTESELLEAILLLEGEDSPENRQRVQAEVAAVKAAEDPQLVEAAEALQAQIAALPGGEEILAACR